ncbi:MAG: alkaline phosphatase D family protein [Rhodoferax sp.]|nr:alkaline phosphatase D family protein [Rhodoferax sp.]
MTTSKTSRRHWMQLALAQATGLLAPTRLANAEPVFDANPFKLGIASGHPTHNSVVLWTRLIAHNPMRNPWGDVAVAVRWELALTPEFTSLLAQGETLAPPELAHSVHVEVQGLPSGAMLYYRFTAGRYVSTVGRTRTMPAPDAMPERLRFALASCQRFHSGPFAPYRHMLADAPDLVVFLGDFIYDSAGHAVESRGPTMGPASKLSDYRLRYELAHSDGALLDVRAQCPWLILWDDHEVTNDYAGGPVRAGTETGQLARQMAAAYQAWYEHQPVSPRALQGGMPGLIQGNAELRIYGTHAWGRLLHWHLLDTRQYRSSPGKCGTAGLFDPKDCDTLRDPQRTMLGQAQETWLLGQLEKAGTGKDTGAQWNAICQSMVFSQFLIPVMGGRANQDTWDGYPLSRDRILTAIQRGRTSNPVMFGGDIHQNWVARIHADPANPTGPVVMPEFVSTSITTPSFSSLTANQFQALAPHCIYTDRHLRGYSLVEVTPQRMQVDFRVIDSIHKADSQVSTIARFEVQADQVDVRQMPL